MSRPRKRDMISIGGKFDPGLATGLKNLADTQGISMREAIRRILTQAVVDGRIPGITDIGLEREREKWGVAATPLYDGEESQGRPQNAQRGSGRPDGSNVP